MVFSPPPLSTIWDQGFVSYKRLVARGILFFKEFFVHIVLTIA